MPNDGIVNVTHTGFTVPDLARASAFFRDVLGFTISATTRHAGEAVDRMIGVPGAELEIAFATGGGFTIELIHYIRPKSERSFDRRHCDPGYAHIAFRIRDIDRMAAAISAAGYRLFSRPQVIEAGPRKGGKNVYAEGPDGIVIELQQDPPSG
jgi:glyoxylase I family protein